MNIEKAKEEIRRTLRAYRKTNPDGTLRIPVEKQRPLLMIGPPGVGKTAIMKQIADETGEGLVSYSMTHHTRQSAIGLPMIEKKMYAGVEQSVTEYTMSEIVASLYDYMEKSGKTRGIMFLDEINCVSETLTPVMLQLLQNKTFGTHALPDGWIIVAAGNPPEYNRAVREFDMATLDRVKNIDVEPDLEVWQRYAVSRDVHPVIRTYLTVYPEHFYVIREVDRQQVFVTARGWEDLSLMIASCEEDGDLVDEEMILEYLRDPQVAHDFYGFYEMFRGFSADWKAALQEDASAPGEVYSRSLTDNASALSDVFRRSLRNQADKIRSLPEVSCLALSGMLFRQLQAEAHGITEARKVRARILEILGAEFFRSRENLMSDTARTVFFDHEIDEMNRKAKIGRIKMTEVPGEKKALRTLEADLREWILAESMSDISDNIENSKDSGNSELIGKQRNIRDDFRKYEQERLAAQEGREQDSVSRYLSHVAEAENILRCCTFGENALRYLQADLERDEDTSLLVL